jgi:molybdopterin-dependent oxidoreductase alpha subunit
MARLYGTNNINNCSYYCHQASGEGLKSTLGTGTATIQYSDMKDTDSFFIFGANPPSNHPRFLKVLMECRRRGGSVVVINPVKESGLVKFSVPSDLRSLLFGGTEIASLYLQPKIGGDIALMKGVAKIILEKSAIDLNFIEQHTEGFSAYKEDINSTEWKDIFESSGLIKEDIESFANIYMKSKKSVFSWGMGLTHHLHGVENIESITNLAMLRGMVGKRGAGLLPLRGHSNVQGIGSMGVTPELKKEVFQKIEELLDISLPTERGLDTLACLDVATKNKIEFAFMLGGNLYSASPDSSYTEKALNKIDFKLYLNSTLNQGHLMGIEKEVLILPVAVRDEEKQSTTQESMFSYIRLSDGEITRFKELHSEVEIISEIASRIILTDVFDFSPFKSHDNIRKAIAKVHPAFAKIADISQEKKEFQIEGRTFHKPLFPTKNTFAQFHVNTLPKRSNAQFLMMSTRSEGQFNSIIYEEEGRYRGQTERWIVMMNKNDIKKLGLKENDLVTLSNNTGEMKNVKVREIEIKEGSIATYYPESNILIPIKADPRSKTPAFKSVEVEVLTSTIF